MLQAGFEGIHSDRAPDRGRDHRHHRRHRDPQPSERDRPRQAEADDGRHALRRHGRRVVRGRQQRVSGCGDGGHLERPRGADLHQGDAPDRTAGTTRSWWTLIATQYTLYSQGKDGSGSTCTAGTTSTFNDEICFINGQFARYPQGHPAVSSTRSLDSRRRGASRSSPFCLLRSGYHRPVGCAHVTRVCSSSSPSSLAAGLAIVADAARARRRHSLRNRRSAGRPAQEPQGARGLPGRRWPSTSRSSWRSR